MTHESDPTKNLRVHVSFDPAIDREAMGEDFARHFGTIAETANQVTSGHGNRDVKLIKVINGMAPTVFEIRPLTSFQRAGVDAIPESHGPSSRWLSALQYAFVSCTLGQPLAGRTETFLPLSGDAGRLSTHALDMIGESVSTEALLEIGAVAYARSKLDFFGVAFAPLPATSALVLLRNFPRRVATQTATGSGTTTTSEV
jgi:hypothetical protein